MDNNMAALQVLLAHKADPTRINNCGVSLLNMLMKRGQTEMASKCVDFMKIHHKPGQLRNFFKMPIRENAWPFRPASGWTPLMTAAENGR